MPDVSFEVDLDASGSLRKLESELKGLGSKVGTQKLNIEADTGGLRSFEGQFNGMASRLEARALGIGSALGSAMKTAGLAAGAAAVATATGGLKLYGDLEKSASDAASKAVDVNGKSAEQIKAQFDTIRDHVMKVSRELGATTVFDPTQVSEALGSIAASGKDVGSMTKEQLKPFLDLASASNYGLADSTSLVMATMTQFGKTMDDSGKIADIYTAAAGGTAASMEDFTNAMRYAGPVAATANVSFETVTASIGKLADVGIHGEMAGTAMRDAMQTLVTPAKASADALDAIGVSVSDVDPRTHDFTQTLSDLKTKADASGQGVSAFNKIFGVTGGVLYSLAGMTPQVNALTNSFQTNTGIADKMAKMMTDNLGGSWENAKGAAIDLAIGIGEKLAPTARKVLDAFSDGAPKIAEFIDTLSSGDFNKIGQKLSEGLKFAVDKAKDLGKQIIDRIKGLDWGALGSQIMGALGSIDWGQLGSTIGDGIGSALAWIDKNVNWNAVGDALARGLNAAFSFASGALGSLWDYFIKSDTDVSSRIQQVFGPSFEWIKLKAGDAWLGVSDAFQQPKAVLLAGWDAIEAAGIGAWNALISGVGQLGAAIEMSIGGAVSFAIDEFAKLVTGVGTAFESVGNTISGIGGSSGGGYSIASSGKKIQFKEMQGAHGKYFNAYDEQGTLLKTGIETEKEKEQYLQTQTISTNPDWNPLGGTSYDSGNIYYSENAGGAGIPGYQISPSSTKHYSADELEVFRQFIEQQGSKLYSPSHKEITADLTDALNATSYGKTNGQTEGDIGSARTNAAINAPAKAAGGSLLGIADKARAAGEALEKLKPNVPTDYTQTKSWAAVSGNLIKGFVPKTADEYYAQLKDESKDAHAQQEQAWKDWEAKYSPVADKQLQAANALTAFGDIWKQGTYHNNFLESLFGTTGTGQALTVNASSGVDLVASSPVNVMSASANYGIPGLMSASKIPPKGSFAYESNYRWFEDYGVNITPPTSFKWGSGGIPGASPINVSGNVPTAWLGDQATGMDFYSSVLRQMQLDNYGKSNVIPWFARAPTAQPSWWMNSKEISGSPYASQWSMKGDQAYYDAFQAAKLSTNAKKVSSYNAWNAIYDPDGVCIGWVPPDPSLKFKPGKGYAAAGSDEAVNQLETVNDNLEDLPSAIGNIIVRGNPNYNFPNTNIMLPWFTGGVGGASAGLSSGRIAGFDSSGNAMVYDPRNDTCEDLGFNAPDPSLKTTDPFYLGNTKGIESNIAQMSADKHGWAGIIATGGSLEKLQEYQSLIKGSNEKLDEIKQQIEAEGGKIDEVTGEVRNAKGQIVGTLQQIGSAMMPSGGAVGRGSGWFGGAQSAYGSFYGNDWISGGAAGVGQGSEPSWWSDAYSAAGGSAPSGGSSVPDIWSSGFTGGSIQWAEGGIADRPTFGLFGEAGPEAFIPLYDRAAALRVLPRVLDAVGVRRMASGGIIGSLPNLPSQTSQLPSINIQSIVIERDMTEAQGAALVAKAVKQGIQDFWDGRRH